MTIGDKIDGKVVSVSCSSGLCPSYRCWNPGQFLHQQKSINGVQSSYRDKHYSCITREYHGCPAKPELNTEEATE